MARQRKQDIDPKEKRLLSVQVTGDILNALDAEAEKHPDLSGNPASRSAVVVSILSAWALSNGYIK